MVGKTAQVPLSISIQKEYNKLVDMLSHIPEKSRLPKVLDGTGGKVSVADLVAYQIGWGTLFIGWYEAGLDGRMPVMPGDGFTKWDYVGLANLFYAKYHYDGAQRQERELHTIVHRILEIVETEHKTENLDKLGVWAWCTLPSGTQWPLSKWIQVNTVAPYKRATTLLRRFLHH